MTRNNKAKKDKSLLNILSKELYQIYHNRTTWRLSLAKYQATKTIFYKKMLDIKYSKIHE